MQKNSKLIILILLTLFLTLFLISGANAASTVYVNNTGNDINGNGSVENPYQTIGKGISSVDDNGTVKIANGKYTGTGNINLTISKNMTIAGQSQAGTIINGTGINWVFYINPGVNIIIQNLTFTNGTSYSGGAIRNEGNLTIENCTFTDNYAEYGGAIGSWHHAQEDNTLSVANCTFTSNNAFSGGAIGYWFSRDAATITNCTFIGNSAYYGGALVSDSNINIMQCTFTKNNATEAGAIYLSQGTLSAHFNRFYNNTAIDRGNAIYSQSHADVENNWWGTNNPNWNNLIYGVTNPTNWVILSVNATPNSIKNTQSSTITADFNHINGGGDLVGGHIPDGIPVNFSLINGPFGNLASSKSYTHNGIASVLFTATSVGVQDVNATLDNQSITTNITINPASDLYLKITSNNNNPTVGQIFTVTYKLGNNGPDAAENVTITFQLPEGITFEGINVDTGKYIYDPTTRTVTWTLDSVPVGDPYLYLTVKAASDGTYKITPIITSDTYNLNSGDSGIITINIQPKNNNSGNEITVKAADNTTIGLQKTGLPLNYLILAVLMVLSGLVPKRK